MAQEGFKRKLAAILSADVKEYSRLMSQDERGTIITLTAYKEAMFSLIEEYKGRVVDAPGDNLLAEFGSVLDAVNCAVEIQRELAERNAELPRARQMEFRIGINLGDIVVEERRIYGDGVNIAARVESLAEGGGICIAGTVHDHVKNKLGLEYEYLGEQAVKNIPEPVHVYRVLSFPGAAAYRVVRAKEKEGRKWRKVAMAVALVLIVGAAAAVVSNHYFRPRSPALEPASVEKMTYPLPDKPSIAVLPFVNMSDDPKQEYLCDGLTEEIITALSKVRNMFVIARNSAFTYKDKAVKVQQVAEELGVRYVLEGGVRKSENRLRITTQLIDAVKGHHLWAERYDRKLKDIFSVQDEITKKVIIALQVELTEGEQARIYGKGTDNFEAYEKFLRGVEYFLRFNKGDNVLSRQAAEEAIALDPEYAAAHVLLGFTHLLDVYYSGKSSRNSMEQALKAAQRALALDEYYPPVHNLLGAIYRRQRQWEKAITEAKRAIALNPNYARGYMGLAETMLCAGRFEEAIELAKKAMRLNPYYHPRYLAILGGSYQMAGHYGEALKTSKEYLTRCEKGECHPLWAHIMLTQAYIKLGREKEARSHMAEVLKINPNYSLERLRKSLLFRDPKHMERYLDALRKAGLPE